MNDFSLPHALYYALDTRSRQHSRYNFTTAFIVVRNGLSSELEGGQARNFRGKRNYGSKVIDEIASA